MELQWNFNQNTKLFIHENAAENIVCEMAANLFRGRCVKQTPLVLQTARLFHSLLGQPQWQATCLSLWLYKGLSVTFEKWWEFPPHIYIQSMLKVNRQPMWRQHQWLRSKVSGHWKQPHIDGLVQDCSISSALAMEILQSCTKPSTYYMVIVGMVKDPLSL